MRVQDLQRINNLDSQIASLHAELQTLYTERQALTTAKASRPKQQSTSLDEVDLSGVDLSLRETSSATKRYRRAARR